MNTLSFLQNLNQAQNEAVTYNTGNLLVLAGAGSGKTRVLVSRIALLVCEHQISPSQILAVTFTNKAALEMRNRIENLLGLSIKSMWAGTFHGLAHKILRIHYKKVGLPGTFQILDSDDQLRLIKQIMNAKNIKSTTLAPRLVCYKINSWKDAGQRPVSLLNLRGAEDKLVLEIYLQYQEICTQSGLVDFAELLLLAMELLQDDLELRLHYQQKFAHILVDEFQDTNYMQYKWLKFLFGKNNAFTVVGDDDQSIYGWRGAKIENIHQFQQDFSAHIIRLEQNYRSTNVILDAANTLISHNSCRLGKSLVTENNSGELIRYYHGIDNVDEAYFVANTIKNEFSTQYANTAILYRTNAQSRVLEFIFQKMNIPYKIYSGLRFFERAEIKDVLAYLRLLDNHHDDASFERIVNWPTRGIGEKTLIKIRQYAHSNSCSLWLALHETLDADMHTKQATASLQAFVQLILEMSDNLTNIYSLAEQVNYVVQHSGLYKYYKYSRDEKAEDKVANLNELINACDQFAKDEWSDIAEADLSPLQAFLAYSALQAGDEDLNDEENQVVKMMTVHAAKGLEFTNVFIVGLNDNIFPSESSKRDKSRLEEERRLFYVAITRTKELLHISSLQNIVDKGTRRPGEISRFIDELPSNVIKKLGRLSKFGQNLKAKFALNNFKQQKGYSNQNYNNIGSKLSNNLNDEWKDRFVKHNIFGEGRILQVLDCGDKKKIQVDFSCQYGIKWLVYDVKIMEFC